MTESFDGTGPISNEERPYFENLAARALRAARRLGVTGSLSQFKWYDRPVLELFRDGASLGLFVQNKRTWTPLSQSGSALVPDFGMEIGNRDDLNNWLARGKKS